MMKKLLSILLILALLAGCAAPGAQTDPTGSTPAHSGGADTTESTSPPETTVPMEDDAEVLAYLRENFPILDGSTSLIPLEASIRSVIFGKSIEEATLDVTHTTTWMSFSSLLDGSVDMIFSCPLSQDQYTIAAEMDVDLELVPVALEGFVFVVNAENPVDTLSQQQLRDIYSGKITNWSQVGGLDEPITAYQRNSDSGSQNFMIDFMGDTPLMDAPTELRPASMSGLMDVIAVNDNARGAIGYSVYAYAANMYGNGNEIKFIQVDGVAPSKASFASGAYPLLGKNYAVFNADEPADSPVRMLADWLLTNRGQTAVAKAGYVTVRDVGFAYEEATLEKYQGTGAGAAAMAPSSYEYQLGTVGHYDGWDALERYLILEPVSLKGGVPAYHVSGLTDKALEQEINDFIDEQFIWAEEIYPSMERTVNSLNGDLDYELYSLRPLWPLSAGWRDGQSAACYATCTNGYLSVVVALTYSYEIMTGTSYFYRVESATWDLLSGRRLTTEELFCDGVDIDAVLNEYLTRMSQEPTDPFGGYVDLKQDFAGLPTDGWCITPNTIYFDSDNPYFHNGASFSLNNLPEGTLVTEQPREFLHCFEGPDVRQIKLFRTSDRDFYYEYNSDMLIQCGYLRESAHPNAARINQSVKDYLNTYFTEEAIRSYYDSINLDGSKAELYMLDWWLENLGGKYLVFLGSRPEYFIPEEERFESYPMPECLIYSLDSGEQIQWQDMLLPGWETLSGQDIHGNTATPDYNALRFGWLRQLEEGGLYVCLYDGDMAYYLEIPPEYVRY